MLERVLFLNAGYCTQLAALVGRRSWGLTRFYAVFVYLEHPEHGACLIDTGYSPWFWKATRGLPGRAYRWATPMRLDPLQDARSILAARGLRPENVRRVFVSHFHGDHIAGLRYFPEARFVYRPAAYETLMAAGSWRQMKHGFLPGLLPDDFVARGQPISEEAFGEGQGALREFRVHDYWADGSLLLVDLPGHALGQYGFVMPTAKGKLFYLVDASWDLDVMLEGKALPWLSRRLQHSYAAYADTQDRLRRLAVAGEYQLLACHCPLTQNQVANDAH